MQALTLVTALAVATPSYFGVAKSGGNWTFRRPDGSSLWSIGCDCVELGTAPASYHEDNPSYSALRLFPNERAWIDDTLAKHRDWGLNSFGGWSDISLFKKHLERSPLPFFTVLHLGAWNRAPFDDMFSPTFDQIMEDAAKSEIPKVKDDPNLVGYFTDNELGWWGDTLFLAYLKMPASAPGKQALVQTLKRHYRQSWPAFQRDWNTTGASFDDLGTITLKPGKNGMQAVNDWVGVLAERYYSTMRRVVRRHDPNRLILGDRYCQYWDLNVVRASRRYVDAVSTNYGCEWNDGSLSRFFLDTLNQMTGKPVVITEFYVNAMENRSGNRNSGKAFPTVQTQAERSACFRRNLVELAQRPYVIGAHWFQYTDEPARGRGDGEDCNMGLLDIKGQPYEGMVDALRSQNLPAIHAVAKPFQASTTIPPAPNAPMAGLLAWPRTRAWVAPREKEAFADLYVCRDRDALYAGILAMDYADDALYADGKIPEADRAAWTLRIDGREPVVVRFGGDRKAVCLTPGVDLAETPGLKHAVIVRIPTADLPGRVALSGSLTQHGRAAKMTWRTVLTTSKLP